MLSWLQIQQRDNLGNFAAESFIPALGPSDMMSVSCVDLSHSITYVVDKGMRNFLLDQQSIIFSFILANDEKKGLKILSSLNKMWDRCL